ncbi:MAG TPA: hydroxymethylglutaryl-CoA synthase [Candidatus Woesebacteria bacterium]|nr:hydroxymethylglutaryl-CoA synthase [Candidatus Woesebacteria bacterium]HPR99394.1 hydroxymethylglutaryl-CoA synthase [Candidatus Woesebacteria bacterium]
MIDYQKLTQVGIAGFGAYVPHHRITTNEIAATWHKNGSQIAAALGVVKKAIAANDEDCITMASEAALTALNMSDIDPTKLGACFMGSESFPYAVKPSSTILANMLRMGGEYFSADLEFACKAGTASLQVVSALIESGMISSGLAVGSDKSQARPSDVLEYTAGSGAGALVLSNDPKKWLAKINCTFSSSSDTPDFWRREGESYPTHAGRFSGEPAYFTQIIQSSRLLFEKTKTTAADYDWAIFHSPNKKFPQKVAGMLGFTPSQLQHSLLVETIGNPYSGASLISLANVLENAQAGDKIFMASYGSGAGSDCFSITTTPLLLKKRKHLLRQMVGNTTDINYSQYLQSENNL